MARVARVTSKGQITIPVEVRNEMGIRKGDDLVFYQGLDGSMHMRVRRLRKGAGSRSFRWPDAPRTPAEVRKAITAKLDKRHCPQRRSRGSAER